jgi:hypothetical protein
MHGFPVQTVGSTVIGRVAWDQHNGAGGGEKVSRLVPVQRKRNPPKTRGGGRLHRPDAVVLKYCTRR